MIKTGVIGCRNLQASELIRVLINHPDVELRWVQDRRNSGKRLDQIVSGIVGECDLIVVDEAQFDNIELVYLCGNRDEAARQLSLYPPPDDLRLIDLSGSNNLRTGAETGWTYGLSEMQRRVLVHEAQRVSVPGNAAMAAMLTLLPMARSLLLNSPLSLRVGIGTCAWPESEHTLLHMPAKQWANDQQQEVVCALKQCQPNFDQPVELTITPLGERRTLAVAARFQCGLEEEKVRQLYEQYYEDHNFVFLVDRPIVTADVENTNKCLLNISKDEQSGLLTVNAVMDVLLKGSAGTAVHAMNLLFGLHERTGLTLKGTGC